MQIRFFYSIILVPCIVLLLMVVLIFEKIYALKLVYAGPQVQNNMGRLQKQ